MTTSTTAGRIEGAPGHPAPAIHPRTVAILAAHVNLRRLRVAYRLDPEVYADLFALSKIALAAQVGDANVTEIAIRPGFEQSSNMTTEQAAQHLGITANAVRRALREGRLTATKHAGRWWITAEDLAAYRIRRAA
ncbi:helix-turn-helix domain-containing protein [Streptosporangium sandarakinum]|uniref:helix-turn-helix domain-containing protein n=1 Tax=Streptosporangium sandarakinum TaxID=1260955 RepID=UPI0033B40CCD